MKFNYVNMDKNLIKKGGRKAVAMTKEDFLSKLAQVHKKNIDFKSNVGNDFDFDNFKEEYISYYVVTEIAKVAKDISKVYFDNENNYVSNSDTPVIDENNPLLGIHTLNNGLTFLGCMAGGDWEYPVFFIIYHDGKGFRGYVPSYGNVYNLDFKTAFGSEEECDNCDDVLIKKKYVDELIRLGIKPHPIFGFMGEECITDIYLKRQGIDGSDSDSCIVVNWDAVKEDILNRIVIV